MLGIALIVFRETLEAALLVGIIAAATSTLPHSRRWIGAGIATGIAGAVVIALAASRIADSFDGLGQDMLNAAILATAVAMLSWHVVWMSRHGAELAATARSLGARIGAGSAALSAAFVAVTLAVLREGAESVLFIFGMLSADNSTADALAGAALGALAGAAVGTLIYRGFRRVPLKALFNITSVLITFLAAALAAQLARLLIQSGVLSPIVTTVWDTSHWLPMDSALGVLLHALIGYDAQPSAMQLIFYGVVLVGLAVARGLATIGLPPARPVLQRPVEG
jgi:high-affinity iron transporter